MIGSDDDEVKLAVGNLKNHITERYPFFAAAFRRLAAHIALDRSAAARFIAAVHRRPLRGWFGAGSVSRVGVTSFRGLPPRREVPRNAAIAPSIRCLSSINKVSMWSVGI